MSYFYTNSQIKTVDADREAASSALVVQRYKQVGRTGINLAVGGYIKGGSTESLAGRKPGNKANDKIYKNILAP